MENKQELVLDFSPQRTATHFLRIYKHNIEALNYGLRLIEYSSEIPERMKDEEEDFLHFQIGEPLPVEDVSNALKRILQTKCFEDFIKGINLCLCDGFTLLKFRQKLCEHGLNSLKNIDDFHNKTYKSAQGKSMPNLLESIETLIKKEFLYKDELLSINKVRACLTHRDGIVYKEKDINNPDGTLKLEWISPFMYQIVDGKQIKKTKGFTVTHNNPAYYTVKNKSKEFAASTVIELGYKEILEIGFTLNNFVQHFVKMQIEYLNETKEKIGNNEA